MLLNKNAFTHYTTVPEIRASWLIGFDRFSNPIIFKPVLGQWVRTDQTLTPGEPCNRQFAFATVHEDLLGEPCLSEQTPHHTMPQNGGIQPLSIPKYRKTW